MAKILYVGLTGEPSGGTRILIEHLNRLSRIGHECEMAFLIPKFCDWMPVSFRQSALVEARMTPYDVVVATEINTWPVVGDMKSFPNADRRKVFVQMAEHMFFEPESEPWIKANAAYRFLGETLDPLTISGWLSDWIYRSCGFKAPIVPNGVNTDMFFPDPFDGLDNGVTRVLVEGHSANYAKDVLGMSIKTARWLRAMGKEFELWGFSQHAQPTGDYDLYWRMPDQDTIRQIYSSCDILIKASRFEGRSCVDVEAMACGCAVNRAILLGDDDLKHNFNCLKVKYGNHTAFRNNAMRMMDDRKLVKRLSGNGITYVSQQLDWDSSIKKLEGVLLD